MENMFEVRKNENRRKQFVEENLDVADKIINTNSSIKTFKTEESLVEEKNNIEQSTEQVVTENQEETLPKDNTNSLISMLLDEDGRTKDSFTYYLDKSINALAELIVSGNSRKKSKLMNLLLKSAILSSEDIKQMATTNNDIQKCLDKIKEN